MRVLLVSLVTAASISACSTPYDAAHPFADGWRQGQVVEIAASAPTERVRYWQCLREPAAATRSQRPHAIVKYSSYDHPVLRLVPVPSGLDLQPKEPVYVNLNRCEDAVARRGGADPYR